MIHVPKSAVKLCVCQYVRVTSLCEINELLYLPGQKETEYREQTATLKEKHSILKLELSEVKLQIQEGDYKIDNFDSIKR